MPDISMQGPQTFALDPGGVVSSAPAAQLGAPNAQPQGVAPGVSVTASGVDDSNSKTFRAITELASAALAPKIKEAAQEQFITGVQKAMTGQALGEIVKDQPWYTDIFSPSAALAGARMYTSQSAIAQWAGKMQEQMPQLAKVSPEALRDAATGTLQGFLTGDAQADSQITSMMVEHMGPLFKQQAKEHYVYVQKQASTAQIGAWEAGAKVYQGFAEAEASGSGTVSTQDKEAAKSRLLGSIIPFADQSDESYARNIHSFLEGSAANGNFQVVKLFKDTGLYDKIPPDQRAQLDRSLKVFGKETLQKQMPKFAMDVATLVNDVTQDPSTLPAKVLALNAKAAAATGVTEADLIPLSSVDNIMGHIMVSQRSAAEKLAAAQAKEDEKVKGFYHSLSQLDPALPPGSIDRCEKLGVCKGPDVEAAGLYAYQAAQTVAEKTRVLNTRTNAGFESVKSMFVGTLRAEEFNSAVGGMSQVYQGLSDNVKPHYFDENDRALMDRFNAQVRSGMEPQAAWVIAKADPGVSKNMLPTDAKDEVSKTIRSYVEGQNETWYHRNTVDDASLRTIEAMTHKAYKTDRGNNPVDVSVARAYAQARANGLDIQGKHAVINAQPQDRPLFTVVGESEKGTADAFEELMKTKAKALGAELDNYEAIRVPDRGGVARIYVNAVDTHGKNVSWSITSPELKAMVGDRIKRDFKSSKTLLGMPDSFADPQALIEQAQ